MSRALHEAQEACGGFLIIDQLKLAYILVGTDLQNAASHCLAACFWH
jgi:hypothetical protein